MARQAHASSDSTVLDNRDRWRSVCCKTYYIFIDSLSCQDHRSQWINQVMGSHVVESVQGRLRPAPLPTALQRPTIVVQWLQHLLH